MFRRPLMNQASRAVRRSTVQTQKRQGSDMPVPQSATAPMWGGHDPAVKSEGWELAIYGYYAAAVFLQAAIIGLAPETSIESWARPEAKARLQLAASGSKFQFGQHYSDVAESNQAELWQKFGDRSVIPGEDDDDDDDDDEVRAIHQCV